MRIRAGLTPSSCGAGSGCECGAGAGAGSAPALATGRQADGHRGRIDEPNGDLDTNPERKAMRAKLQTPEGKSGYARRKAIVEPVFGQIKEAQGYRRFLLRGIDLVRTEWSLLCTAHNLRKLFRARRTAATAVQ